MTEIVTRPPRGPAEPRACVGKGREIVSDVQAGDEFTIGDTTVRVDAIEDELGEVALRIEEPGTVSEIPIGDGAFSVSEEPGLRTAFVVGLDDTIPMNGASLRRPGTEDILAEAANTEQRLFDVNAVYESDAEAFRAGKRARKVRSKRGNGRISPCSTGIISRSPRMRSPRSKPT